MLSTDKNDELDRLEMYAAIGDIVLGHGRPMALNHQCVGIRNGEQFGHPPQMTRPE
jgi:hypothetical protein